MKLGGALLAMLGVASHLLPQFSGAIRGLNLFPNAQPVISAVLTLLGIALSTAGTLKQEPTPAAPRAPIAPAASVAPFTPSQGLRCQCGETLWPGDQYCGRCGASIPPATSAVRRCTNPQCGQALSPGKKFCTACGARAI